MRNSVSRVAFAGFGQVLPGLTREFSGRVSWTTALPLNALAMVERSSDVNHDLPAAMRCTLVCYLPDAVDPQQVMEIYPPLPLVRSTIPTDLNRCGVADLRHGNEAADDAPAGRRRPFLKALGDRAMIKGAVGVDIEHPGVFVKGFLELGDVVVVKSIDVELHHADDRVVVVGPLRHQSASQPIQYTRAFGSM